MTDSDRSHLIDLYRQLYELTNLECQRCRPKPLSCCHSGYCDLAAKHAKEFWGTTLVPTSHPTLPFMGPTGCTVAPHLRPLCTIHTCEVVQHGGKHYQKWNEKYFGLKAEIERLEVLHHGERAVWRTWRPWGAKRIV